MKKIKLLLLDACIVIRLHEWHLWDQVLAKCEIVVPEAVLIESLFYEVDGEKVYIDLKPCVDHNQIEVIGPSATEVQAFKDRFLPSYQGELDAGEAECLTILVNSKETYLICSADKIVPKVLGCLRREEQGLSLEELLEKCGLGRKLPADYGKKRFSELVARGQREGFLGSAIKPTKAGN